MKSALPCLFSLLFCIASAAQTPSQAENIFIITTDGFRWQEVFTGADPAMIGNSQYVQDTSLSKQLYWDEDLVERRRKLMPFFWDVIAKQGQLFGNRQFENKVNVKNLYKISYPGYNEIFTGTTDPRIIINLPRNNKNGNLLEWLNDQKSFRGQVVAFCSWNLFPFILNERRSDFLVNSGYEPMAQEEEDSVFGFINRVQENVVHKSHTRHDWLTFLNAREYIEKNQPRIVFIGLGETDEFAHQGKYDLYLQQAGAVDRMIAELWYYVQTHAFYKDKTCFIITTDHGRGDKPRNWHTHSFLTQGSGQTWLALLGPGISPIGELKDPEQIYEKQFAATIAHLLGLGFGAPGRNANPISLNAGPENLDLHKGQRLVSK